VITKAERAEAIERTLAELERAGIAVTAAEREQIEVADFGLGRLREIGLEILVYVNTERVCAKELVLFPWQLCPEHRHPPVAGEPGKEETFRCRAGTVYLYLPGETARGPLAPGQPAQAPMARVADDVASFLTVWREVVLQPGEQYTLMPGMLHWFQAGAEGAIVSEFSTKSRDDADIFTDPRIDRLPKVAG
jgi:D-lyxose ketol-isomerase